MGLRSTTRHNKFGRTQDGRPDRLSACGSYGTIIDHPDRLANWASTVQNHRYALGPLVLDAGSRAVFHDQNLLPLGDRAVSVLLLLVERAGQLVTKDELMTGVWGTQAVEENNLAVQIAALRRSFAEIQHGQRWLITFPKRGYSFHGPVVKLDEPGLERKTIGRHEPRVTEPPKIAVLPFETSGFSTDARFVDGIVTEITTALSKLRSISVIGRNFSSQFHTRPIDAKIVLELGIQYILCGTVRTDGYVARISIELADAKSGVQIWAERFDGDSSDIFALQDQITSKVVSAVEPRLLFAEVNRAKDSFRADLSAYDLFLKATAHFYAMTRADLDAAIPLLHRAIAIDPTHARSYALLGRCYVHRKIRGWVQPDDSSIAEGARYARIAADYGGDNPEVLWMAAIGVGLASGNIFSAVSLIDRALVLNPSSAESLTYSGMLRAYLGDYNTALEHVSRSTQLSPIDAQTYNKFTAAAFAHFMGGHFEAAWNASEFALAYKLDYEPALRMRAACLGLLGRAPEAREAITKLIIVSPKETLASIRTYYESVFKVPGSCEMLIKGLARGGLPSG